MIALTDDLVRDHLDLFADFVVATSHEPLDRINGVLGIGNRLTFCHLADEAFAGLGKANYGRRSAPSFFISNDLGLATFHDCYAGVGGTEVNSDNL